MSIWEVETLKFAHKFALFDPPKNGYFDDPWHLVDEWKGKNCWLKQVFLFNACFPNTKSHKNILDYHHFWPRLRWCLKLPKMGHIISNPVKTCQKKNWCFRNQAEKRTSWGWDQKHPQFAGFLIHPRWWSPDFSHQQYVVCSLRVFPRAYQLMG